MPRIRTLKPEVWQDEAVGALSHEARLLFIGLITQADDDGRQEGNLKLLRSRIYPFDDLFLDQILQWLVELEDADLVVRYEANGSEYIVLPGWKSHQKISHRTPSKLPRPPKRNRNAPEDSGKAREPSQGALELSSPRARGRIGSRNGSDQGTETPLTPQRGDRA